MLDVAEKAAKLAGEALLKRFRGKLRVSVKADQSLVTEADLASDKIISDVLSSHFPNDFIFSEEKAEGDLKGAYPVGSRVWIVDPLDGTSNYANGLSYYAVSIGAGRVLPNLEISCELGVVYAPASNDLFSAIRGKGAKKNGKTLPRLAERHGPKAFEGNFLVTGFYYDTGEPLKQDIARFERVALACKTVRRMGAAALDLALCADGIFDGFWEKGLKPWDIAAGSLLLEEVGGELRNYDTQGFSLFGEGLIAGRPETVDSIQKLL